MTPADRTTGMPDAPTALTLADLDARLRQVEVVQTLILNLLSTTRPLDGVLRQYGATETQARTFYLMLDDLATRAAGDDANDRPSFAFFELRMNEIFPALRNNREFMELILDTLKLERPAYRDLQRYTAAKGWPSWR